MVSNHGGDIARQCEARRVSTVSVAGQQGVVRLLHGREASESQCRHLHGGICIVMQVEQDGTYASDRFAADFT